MIADSPQSICGGRALNEAILARQAAGRRHRRDRQHLSGAAEPLRADRRQEKEANRDAVHKAIGDFPQHRVLQIEVPWAEDRARLTALCEAVVIDWLRAASIAAVAQQMRLSWDEVDGVMKRAVQRGKQRREVHLPRRIGVDETSFQKRHEYVTVINDLDGHVVHVADGRSKETLEQFFQQFDRQGLADVETVAMDMWEPTSGSPASTCRTRTPRSRSTSSTSPSISATPLTRCGEPSTASWRVLVMIG